MGTVIGIIVILAVAAFLAVLTCRSKSSDLFKWLGIILFVAFALTWVLPYGIIQDGTFYEYGMKRLGLTDIPSILYNGLYFGLTTVVYLLVLGGFYGVLSKTKSYQTLVKKLAGFVKKHQYICGIVIIILLVCLTSVLNSALPLLVFVPFLVNVLLNAKFDKITTMGLTFGSILVGTLGATYGTEGLNWFNTYLETELSVGLLYRLIIAGFALVLFVLYNVYRIYKMNDKKNINEAKDDMFVIEETKDKTHIWPTIVILAVLFIFVVLGYFGWESVLGVECFNKFHEWLIGLKIGEDFTIFSYILGTSAKAFGEFEITALITLLLVLTVIVALTSGKKMKEIANDYAEGFGKMIKPIVLYSLAYSVFIVAYMCVYVPTISDWAFGLTKAFNPFITMITAFITSIFHADLGYTGYVVGTVITSTYANDLPLVHTLYVSMYGLVQILVPSSALLLVGLSYLKVDYKAWFKYIWMFAVAMVLVVVALSAIVTYAM